MLKNRGSKFMHDYSIWLWQSWPNCHCWATLAHTRARTHTWAEILTFVITHARFPPAVLPSAARVHTRSRWHICVGHYFIFSSTSVNIHNPGHFYTHTARCLMLSCLVSVCYIELGVRWSVFRCETLPNRAIERRSVMTSLTAPRCRSAPETGQTIILY